MSLPKLTFLRAVVILEVLLLVVWVELYALGGPPPFVRTAGIALSTLTIIFILLMLCTKGEPPKTNTEHESEQSAVDDTSDQHTSDELPELDSSKGQEFERECELHRARMTYAWAWFQYHADQRLKAFNFFLVILGILVVAYGAAMKEGLTNATTAAASKAIQTSTTLSTTTMAPTNPSTPSTAAASKATQTSTTSSSTTTSTTPTTPSIPSNVEVGTAAYSYSIFAVVVAFCGVIISIGFFFIEIRNVELVECGRTSLNRLEGQLKMSLRQEDRERTHLAEVLGRLVPQGRLVREKTITHWFWMRAIYIVAFLGFVFAFNYALWGF